MPVVLNINVMQTLHKIGVDPVLLAALTQGKYKITMGANQLLFQAPGKPEASVAVNSALLTSAAKALLPSDQVKALTVSLNKSISQVLEGKQSDPVTAPAASTQGSEPFKAPNTPIGNPSMTQSLGAYSHMVPALMEHQPFSAAQMSQGDPVPLVSAKGLYAPVRGTDSSSRYFLIAVYQTFKVAARLVGSKLSLRVEGQVPDNSKKALVALGFSMNSQGHISTHLAVSDHDEAKRFVGAMIGAIGAPLTPMPDVGVIVGKGK